MIALWLGLLACGGEPSPEINEESEGFADASQEAKLITEVLEERALDITQEVHQVLAPSPEETRLSVERAGLVTSLSSMVKEREFTLDGLDSDHTALRVGIVLSDTILLIKEMPKTKLVANLRFIEDGLKQIGAGKGLYSTIADYRTQVNNDAMSREDLLFGLDQIASMSVPEEGLGATDDSGPMLQAGAWTAGVSLVSQAILSEEKIDAADTLLRHGPTADYFLTYVKKGAENKASSPVLLQLEASLQTLKNIAEKEEITMADVELVKNETQDLLDMI